MIRYVGIETIKMNRIIELGKKTFKKFHRYRWQTGWILFSVFLNVLSWKCQGFSDWFRKWIFPVFRGVMGRITSLFSGSVGELMLVAAVLLVLFWILLVLLSLFRKISRFQKLSLFQKVGKLVRRYHYFLSWVVAAVCFIMTTNCFILYHCSSFEELYLDNEAEKDYTVADLIAVRDYVISRANELAPEMARDENGDLVYAGNMEEKAGAEEEQAGDVEKRAGDEEEMAEVVEEKARAEMQRLGKEYDLLAGYYTDPKIFRMSKFFSQQYMMGYYFPFSMEANYNGMMYLSNMPPTICHELSHIKGFMFEDDANFIGYLACVTSEDPFFQYCGYISVIDYLNNDLYENLGESTAAYLSYRQCSQLVARDNIFLTKQAWEEVEESAILETETVRKASSNFLDTNLNLNGVEEGIASYGKVVELLLKYYDESGKCN